MAPEYIHSVSEKGLRMEGLVPAPQRVLRVQLGSDVELIKKLFNSFCEQTFTECLLYAKHWARQ